ncbi:MAG: hypothetical protein ABI789_01835 [Usitatibacter sp.]
MSPDARNENPSQARARLKARLAELNEEIRGYPQPIARCDAQLGGLVEERARLQAELERLGPADG